MLTHTRALFLNVSRYLVTTCVCGFGEGETLSANTDIFPCQCKGKSDCFQVIETISSKRYQAFGDCNV